MRTGLAASAGTVLSGCGTVLHPERRGQDAGQLDWNVVALDALGLLLFFVPGVIAFAVDFNNGTIYLPPEGYARRSRERPGRLVTRSLPPDRLTHEGLEHVVSQHVKQPVRLAPGMYETRPLDHIDEFWPTQAKLAVS